MKPVKAMATGLALLIVGFLGAWQGDVVPVEYLDIVGMEPAYSCDAPMIKGNINAKNKVYHVPGGVYYDNMKLDPTEGERLFCTEAEAEAAGWRKSKR